MQCMQDGDWLNDELINVCMALLQVCVLCVSRVCAYVSVSVYDWLINVCCGSTSVVCFAFACFCVRDRLGGGTLTSIPACFLL